jgi:hypothetical protein
VWLVRELMTEAVSSEAAARNTIYVNEIIIYIFPD